MITIMTLYNYTCKVQGVHQLQLVVLLSEPDLELLTHTPQPHTQQ